VLSPRKARSPWYNGHAVSFTVQWKDGVLTGGSAKVEMLPAKTVAVASMQTGKRESDIPHGVEVDYVIAHCQSGGVAGTPVRFATLSNSHPTGACPAIGEPSHVIMNVILPPRHFS
jgi:hypothetical protein